MASTAVTGRTVDRLPLRCPTLIPSVFCGTTKVRKTSVEGNRSKTNASTQRTMTSAVPIVTPEKCRPIIAGNALHGRWTSVSRMLTLLRPELTIHKKIKISFFLLYSFFNVKPSTYLYGGPLKATVCPAMCRLSYSK